MTIAKRLELLEYVKVERKDEEEGVIILLWVYYKEEQQMDLRNWWSRTNLSRKKINVPGILVL